MSREAERELEAIRAKMARGELDPAMFRVPQTPATGLGAILGKWPGDETDRDVHLAMYPDHGFSEVTANGDECRTFACHICGFVATEPFRVLGPDLPPGFDLGEVVE
jgi:hypothetical protein